MKTVLIRADSSSDIGTGHIMRDLVLAKQFPDARIIFATRPLEGNIANRIEDAGYDIAWLNSMALDELTEVIKKNKVDTMVIDHYGIGHKEEKLLKKHTEATIFVLDDTYEQHYCDILLNHNIYADSCRYIGLVPTDCELRCGGEFTLLRDEFIEARRNKISLKQQREKKAALLVFIAMGGADHGGVILSILKALESVKGTHMHVLTTKSNRNLKSLRSYVANKSQITVHIDSDLVAVLMAQCDIAIVSPSVVLNEVFYMGLPFIAIQTADNQKEMTSFLQRNNYNVLSTFNQEKLINMLDAFKET